MTLLDLLTAAACDLGVKGAGETLEAADQQMLLNAFNLMLDAFSGLRSMLFTVPRAVYPLTVGQYSYTIGPTGNFAQERPAQLQGAGLVLASTGTPAYELPLKLLTADEYRAIGIKGLPSTYPTAVYYDLSDASGNGTLIFNYSPQQGGNSVALYYPQQLAQYTAAQLSQPIVFPPAYGEALEYGLALRAAPKYNRECPAEAAMLGRAALARIQARNDYTPELSAPFRGRGGYNWLTDERTAR